MNTRLIAVMYVGALVLTGCSLLNDGIHPDRQIESAPNTSVDTETVMVNQPSNPMQDCFAEDDSQKLVLQTLINNSRASGGQCGDTQWPQAAPLTLNAQLDTAASVHAIDMAENDFFMHKGSDGNTADSRIGSAGYQWVAIAENIAGGQRSAMEVINDWLGSPGHCRNIMQPEYTELGLACHRNPSAELGIYWTAVFARPLQ